MTNANTRSLTLGQVARTVGIDVWQVQRALERGFDFPTHKIGVYRCVYASDLPLVRQALERAGYLPHAPGAA
ncbi:MAG TPA: hypothetical protein VEL76_15020 [Gemmataceae bacterium]|nr:hypothetical protein [Gemmataceae bacterium]